MDFLLDPNHVIDVVAGKVAWTETCIMFVATVVGGFLGARYSKRLHPVKLRLGIVIFNFLITIAFFIKTYY